MIPIDENIFFREATLRICGNLEIHKALHACLLYIRDYIPADFMGFVIYLPDTESYETIASAHLKGGDTASVRIAVPPAHQRQLKTHFTIPRVTISNREDQDEAALRMMHGFGWPQGHAITLEMILAGKRMGAVMIIHTGQSPYTGDHAGLLQVLNEPFGIALTNGLRYRKVRRLQQLLADDKRYLQDELFRAGGEQIVGADGGLKTVMTAARQVAGLNSPVLLSGETGVGKEVLAKAIHNASGRRLGPFIAVNCGAITDALIDSELFGHEKGAFTGAVSRKRGRFERAHGGTIFLDEIGELPPEAQVRLLRVLQDMEIERVGGEAPIPVDCRVITATHRDLTRMIQNGSFREDLYFRLNVFPIVLPPLRERKGDIPALVHHFIRKKSRELALGALPELAPGALAALAAYDWPGNVRELENAVERALIVCRDNPLTFDQVQAVCAPPAHFQETLESVGPFPTLDELAAVHMRKALKKTGGRIEGPGGAAKLLGVHPATLRQRMRKLGVPFGRKAGLKKV